MIHFAFFSYKIKQIKTRKHNCIDYQCFFFIFVVEPKDILLEFPFLLTSSTLVAFPLEDLIVPEVAVDAELLDS